VDSRRAIFALWDTPLFQPFTCGGRSEASSSITPGIVLCATRCWFCFADEILTLGGREVRAVDGEKRGLAKVLIGGVRENFLNVTGVPHLHGRKPRFINRNVASDVDIIFNNLLSTRPVLDADALQTFRRN